jgi:pullulanase
MSTAPHFHATNQLPHPADGIVSKRELGAIYDPARTVFRVWAPTADRLTLNLYESPSGGRPNLVAMRRLDDGCWETVLWGDWQGIYYTYTAAGSDPRFDPERELLDPYARCVTGHRGRAIVVNERTPVADRPTFPVTEAIIYEMHLRDFTIDPDSGIQRRGKYLGLTEAGTHLTGRSDITTGLDHLLELGVNVVQLMPIMEFHSNEAEDEYGWGYDVVHHHSPDGWFATVRHDARRVTEVKQLVDTLHRHGLRVTLDVVFNHTFESTREDRVYSFEGLVPGYYYRMRPDGTYWNGSGVGNEFRTEAPMVRRYLLDTLRHWVNEYKIDGFRFDLLGLIDYETLQMIVRELRAIDPEILIYGEPWAGGSSAIEIVHKGRQRGHGWAVFNDHFRDAMKGNVFDARETGFIQAGRYGDQVRAGIAGAVDDFADTPSESINYVECHDNHTLWDRLAISTIDDSRVTPDDRRAMCRLAAVLLMTSQGIPFIQTGQAFLRTKFGDHNSYDKPDAVNMIRWRQKAENYDIFLYYRELIALRKAHPLFRLATAAEVRQALTFLDDQSGYTLPHGCVGWITEDVTGRDTWQRALVLVNPHPRPVQIPLPPGDWQLFVDGHRAGALPRATTGRQWHGPTITIARRSALVLAELKHPSSTKLATGGVQ